MGRRTVQMRWPAEIVEQVDASAALAGLSRTAFVLEALGFPRPTGPDEVRAPVPDPGWGVVLEVRPDVPGGEAVEVREVRVPCKHPRSSRRNLGYMVRCEACGARL